MKYFIKCATLEALKAEYKRLAKLHHPDLAGGDLETMKAINAQYDEAVKHIADNPAHEDAQQAAKETPEQFRDIIAALIVLEGIIIELCGAWIWITGDTFQHKETLKAAGCMWAKKKAAWYWHRPEDGCRKGKRNLSMDEIRDYHGSQIITGKGNTAPFRLMA